MSLPCTTISSTPTLGVGFLTWNAEERRRDRYGFVCLVDFHRPVTDIVHAVCPSHIDADTAERYIGFQVALKGEVLMTRQSEHIGDLFRGIVPSTPNVGDVFTLGTGAFVTGPWLEGGLQVGVKPGDGRANDWLDPHVLYQLHSQDVRLFLELVKA